MPFSHLPYPNDLDRISSLNFSAPSSDMLVASCFDNTTLFFSCSKQSLLGKVTSPSPILDTSLTSSKTTFAGLLDGTVRYIDFENTKVSSPVGGLTIGEDVASGISQIRSLLSNQLLATSFDGNMYQIDARSHRVANSKRTGSKIFAMDASNNYVTLGKAQNTVEIYDIRNLNSPVYVRPTGLRFQTTAVRHFPSGEGYALSSIDGRVSIEYFDDSPEIQSAKYAFKSHRTKDSLSGIDTVYPVTGLKFHPRYETLFTAGGDGNVCVWNWTRRKRMKMFSLEQEPLSAISHMDINEEGNWLALGLSDSSYGRTSGVDQMKRGGGALVIKHLSPQDCEPKGKPDN